MDFFAVGWCQFINILLPFCVSNTLSIFPIYSCTKATNLCMVPSPSLRCYFQVFHNPIHFTSRSSTGVCYDITLS